MEKTYNVTLPPIEGTEKLATLLIAIAEMNGVKIDVANETEEKKECCKNKKEKTDYYPFSKDGYETAKRIIDLEASGELDKKLASIDKKLNMAFDKARVRDVKKTNAMIYLRSQLDNLLSMSDYFQDPDTKTLWKSIDAQNIIIGCYLWCSDNLVNIDEHTIKLMFNVTRDLAIAEDNSGIEHTKNPYGIVDYEEIYQMVTEDHVDELFTDEEIVANAVKLYMLKNRKNCCETKNEKCVSKNEGSPFPAIELPDEESREVIADIIDKD
jgi:hypothetical protein